MISYIYTGELAGGLQLLDIQVDMYELPGWMELLCTMLRSANLSRENVTT